MNQLKEVNTKTVGNNELEMEYLASRILVGEFYTPNYIDLCSALSRLPFSDASEDLYLLLLSLREYILTELSILDSKKVKMFFDGNSEFLFSLLVKIHELSSSFSLILETQLQQQIAEDMFDVGKHLMVQPDTSSLVAVINYGSSKQQGLEFLNSKLLSLKVLKDTTALCLSLYGVGGAICVKSPVKAKDTVAYRLFLQQLCQEIPNLSGNLDFSRISGNILGSVIRHIPQVPSAQLDPYNEEVLDNLLKILSSPDKYYIYCKRDEVLNEEIAKCFHDCYPEFFFQYVQLNLENFEKMDEQEQISFKRCFGLSDLDVPLINICQIANNTIYVQ